MKLEDFLNIEEITQPRTTQEYIIWFDKKLNITKELRGDCHKQMLLHGGIAKYFYEELFPLYLLLQHKRNEWYSVQVRPVCGNQNFDVRIDSNNDNIPAYIEITVTDRDYLERHRMEYFAEKGAVSLSGKVSVLKNKSGKEIIIEETLERNSESVSNKIDQMTNAIDRKIKKDSYPENTALLIYFNDYVPVWQDRDLLRLKATLDACNKSWNRCFRKLYLVGASGKNFLEM